ncbi:hypothetical protein CAUPRSCDRAFT_11110 [Caulochytrium protostelioides]|uniref:Uncharacterized protein n=1 Tax=Caulochytrium protostelioides TaxID=1555241 RepID=A0A4P9WY51_9FUNG|nr:hypothetical protein CAUPRSCDRAFT_11110 [Caulochytrium protostelioides]
MASTAPADAAAPVAGGGGTCTSKPSPPSGSSSRRVSLFHPRDLGPAGGAASTGSPPRAAGSSWSSALFHPLAGPYAHAAAFSTAAAAGSTSARAGPSAGAGAGAERQQELESFDHPDLPDVGERPNFFESLKRKLYGTSGWELPGLGHDTDPATDAAAKEVLDAAVGVAGALGATPFSAVTRTIMTATTPPPLSVSTRGRHVHDRLPSPDRRPLSPARARPASRSPMASPRHDAPRRHSLYTSSPMAFPVRGRGVDPRDMDLESVGSEPGSARAGFALHLELPSTIRPSSLFSLGPRSASTTDRGGVGGGVGYGHRSGHDHGVQSAGGGSGAAVSDPVPIPASLTLPTHNGSPTASSLTVNSDTSSSHVHDNNYDPVQHSQALGIDVGALETSAVSRPRHSDLRPALRRRRGALWRGFRHGRDPLGFKDA